jgi:hypothetical protein
MSVTLGFSLPAAPRAATLKFFLNDSIADCHNVTATKEVWVNGGAAPVWRSEKDREAARRFLATILDSAQ